MTDSTQIPNSLNDLGDAIKAIERESGQPSQLVAKVGADKYLVGDLTKRTGEYRLEMLDEYAPDPFEREEKVKNPHKGLTGNYASFDALSKAVEKTQNQSGGLRRFLASDVIEAYLIGSPDHGYSIGVEGMNLGSAGGQTYNAIGTIIFPLLQDGEKVSVEKISR